VSEKQTFILAHRAARQSAMRAVMYAPDGYLVEVKPKTRTLAQNALLHKFFSHVAKNTLHCGRVLTAAQWKTLFISGHAIATGMGADMLPGLEGEFVNIRESSAHMSVKRLSSLIEYIRAWCIERDIELSRFAPPGYELLAEQYA